MTPSCWVPKPPTPWQPDNPPVTAETLPDILAGHRAVVLYFWVIWDNGGRVFDPLLQEALLSVSDGLAFYSVDGDAELAIAGRYGIQTTPTLVFLLNGQEAGRWVGKGPMPEITMRLHLWRDASQEAA